MQPAKRTKLEYTKLLNEALTLEGKLSDCYRVFHSYSFGNQLLAMLQLPVVEPINTYKGWLAIGRQVKAGEKAIELCMPVTIKDKDENDEERTKTLFIFRRNWFSLSQTDGKDFVPAEIVPEFDTAKVLKALGVAQLPFSMINGNVQGYATAKGVAINPVAKHPVKTLWHELAHILLGHCEQATQTDTGTLSRNLIEVEAESVAYLLSNVFGATEGLDESRGYIQNWNDTAELPETSAKRIIKTVNKIISANK